MNEFKLLSKEEIKELDNLSLMKYKQELWKHGEDVEEYILMLQTFWHEIVAELKERVWEIEWELACIQAENNDRLYGSGNGSTEEYLN